MLNMLMSRLTSGMALLLPSFISLSCLCVEAKPAQEKTFFETKSAGFSVKWTDKNLSATAVDSAQVLFSAREKAQREKPAKKDKTTEDRAFTLLSVVGPIMSYQDERTLDWPGMVHPGVGDVRQYGTVDLRHPQKSPSLADYFAAPDLFAALMNNSIIKKAVKESKGHPTTLPLLVKTVQNASVMVTDKEAGEQKLLFNPDFLNRFCFNGIKQDSALVSISLYDQEGNQIKAMDITVPVKDPDLKKWLQSADLKKEGVLAKNLATMTKDAETDFHFDP